MTFSSAAATRHISLNTCAAVYCIMIVLAAQHKVPVRLRCASACNFQFSFVCDKQQ
jgi:hypothetical protein